MLGPVMPSVLRHLLPWNVFTLPSVPRPYSPSTVAPTYASLCIGVQVHSVSSDVQVHRVSIA